MVALRASGGVLYVMLQPFRRHRAGALLVALNEPKQLLVDNIDAEIDAFVADIDGRPGDQLVHLMLALAAERAIEELLLRRLILRAGGRTGVPGIDPG